MWDINAAIADRVKWGIGDNLVGWFPVFLWRTGWGDNADFHSVAVGKGSRDLKTSCQAETIGSVQNAAFAIGFGQGTNFFNVENAAGGERIGLNDFEAIVFQVLSENFQVVVSLAACDWYIDYLVQPC